MAELLNNAKELKTYSAELKKKLERENKKQEDIKERIDRQTMSFIPLPQFKLDTDKSLYIPDAHQQGFTDLFFDRNKFKGKETINSGLIVIEDRTHKTEIIFEGNFEATGNYNYNARTEKIKDVLEEHLVTQYQDIQNPTIYIPLKQLAKDINVKATDLRKRIVYILESLETIRLSYKTKGKLKKNPYFEDFESMRMVSSSGYNAETDIIEVNFDNKYAYSLATHQFFQLPKKYRQINDNTFQYAYPLAKYIYELCRQSRYEITFNSLYNQIKKIPRIEDVRKQRGSITQKIYEPLMKHFEELNEKEDFTIGFENEDFILVDNTKKNIDFEKMLNTKILIKWKNKPDYNNLEKVKEKQRKLIEAKKELYTESTKKYL